MLSDDGGWCWFQSPRATFLGDRLIVGSVASGARDATRRGNVEIHVHELASGHTHRVVLHERFELDDHDSPALLVRPDGRVLALYAKHGSENRFYHRVSEPHDPLTWAAEKTFSPSARTRLTYGNCFVLPAEQNRVYDFFRGLDASYKPSFVSSDDLGDTWRGGNVVIDVPSVELHRPYVRYASNGSDTIHLVYTEAHPRDFDNSVYHVFYRGGVLHGSDGRALRELGEGLASPNDGTRIFHGDADHVAWVVDVAVDRKTGFPLVLYSVQHASAGLRVGEGGDDLRYRTARWTGNAWQDSALAHAGARLYAGEDDYTGLGALDPSDPSVVYVSTNANPESGAPLLSGADGQRHHEIFGGRTRDEGHSWEWTAITRDSSADNLRPILVVDGARKALLWLRGAYRSYTSYDQAIVVLLLGE